MGTEEPTSDKHEDGACQRMPDHPNEVFCVSQVHFLYPHCIC